MQNKWKLETEEEKQQFIEILATLFKKLDDKFDKTQEYHEKALAIRVEIKGRRAEAADYGI